MNTKLFLILLFSLSSFLAFSQGVVTGKITDSKGESLPGVNIVVEGKTNGTATDINGNYELRGIVKEDVIVFSFIGFQSQKITYTGQKGIDVTLNEETENLQEVVITAQAKGQKNAIRQQINSTTIKNVVAPDRLQENPDANSVEAIGRLPGISVLRGGGEGSALVIRGLEPKYANITLNGIQMPSTSGSSRETNISGISQYVLQGVEVYKALTPDMEANSVAGTVNLKLRETPSGLHYNAMAQLGYNNLNDYWGNYKLQGEIGNRFFDEKLGVFLSLNAERVNRSTETMSAGYGLESTDVDILLNSFSMNLINTIKYRRSAMLSLDYKLSSSTKLSLYSLYSYSKDEHERQTKNYNTTGTGDVSYSFHDNPYRNTDIWQSALSGITNLNFLNLEIDYGLAYSISKTDDPKSRNWSYNYIKVPVNGVFSTELRRKDPSEVITMFTDNGDSLQDLRLWSIDQSKGELSDENLTAYLNFKVPFKIGDFISGNVKTGGTYRKKVRYQDDTSGGQAIINNQFAKPVIADSLNWIVLNGKTDDITAIGLEDDAVNSFLNGQYNFGRTYNINRMNEITDTWDNYSNYWLAQGQEVWSQFIPKEKIGFSQNITGSMLNDQDIKENYFAGYLMAEIRFGTWVMLLPGVRYEETDATMKGFSAIQPTLPGATYEPIPGTVTDASRGDKFWLPMAHLRVTPFKSFYTHFAYTQTLSRPDFNSISPNTWVNTGFAPFSYITNDPLLKAEKWENYDLQFTVHGEKIGLLSVGGFYKSVDDKIWQRSYKRIKGDPVIEPFPDAALVNVSKPENHKYPIYVKGIEFETQTSFWYLPKPFSYFTLTANYTYTESETQYPLSKILNVIPPQGGRPVPTRIDSTATGPMLFQPKHIVNTSLGFNRNGLNVWFSFQYNGEIFAGKNYQLEELDPLKEKFYRYDLQVSQKLKGKLKGFEILGNFANLSDFMEVSRLRGDTRPTYLENYGWTADLGIRYRF